jgi:hypothetical protein
MVVFSLIVVVTPCGADEKEEAKQLFDEGKLLFVEKRYEAAIEKFEASLEKFPTYNGFFNLANCYRALLQYDKALAAVERMRNTMDPSPKPEIEAMFAEFEDSVWAVVGFLRLTVEPDDATVTVDGREIESADRKKPLILSPGYHEVAVWKDEYEKKIEHIQIASEQETVLSVKLHHVHAELFLTVYIPGALVTVDDEPVGKTPLDSAIVLTEGSHRILVSKPGYQPAEQVVNMVPGTKTALSMSLKKIVLEETVASPNKRERTEQTRLVISPVTWAFVGGTMAAGVMGGIFWGLAGGKAREVQDNNVDYVEAPTDEDALLYDKMRREARDTGMRYEKVALGLTITTGLLAAGTVVFFIIDSKRRAANDDTPSVTATPSGLSVRF